MLVNCKDGTTRDYAFAQIGSILVPLVAGSKLERLFFRVADVSSVPRRLHRFERPPLDMVLQRHYSAWADDSDDDEAVGALNINNTVYQKWHAARNIAIREWFEEYSQSHANAVLDANPEISFVPRL